MATAREARAERLNERLRGAQRVNVEDESFSLDIPGLDPAIFAAPQPSSSPHQPGSSSAKRRRLNDRRPTSASSDHSGSARSTRRASKDLYDLPNTSKETVRPANASTTIGEQAAERDETHSSASHDAESNHVPDSEGEPEDEEEELGILPEPSSTSASGRQSGVRNSIVEEIEESPISKPGSGRRRSVAVSSALASSARLRDALGSDSSMPSSPLTRKSRRSDAALSVGSERRVSRLSMSDEMQLDAIDEIAGELLSQAQERSPSRDLGHVEEVDEMEGALVPEDEEGDEEEEEQAEEISAVDAAKALGGRRPRQSLRSGSIELGSRDQGEADEEEYEDIVEPAPRRKRGRPSKSPAVQKQPAPKPRKRTAQKQKPEKPRPPAPAKPRRSSTARRQSDQGSIEGDAEGGNAAIEVTVQRFVNFKKRRRNDDDEADDIDPLQLDIPFANSSRESAVDVFAQVCEEVISNTLNQFEELAQNSPDPAKKKEFRIKIRAVEAYREVLKSRHLQHAIHLNHWQSLRKRVRQTQKEKLSLREEILRIKAEREQVALRMDAVRAKYDADNKESSFLLDTSSTMHDIDMAVSKGQDAPKLSGKAQKEAELANLEFIVAQITDQVSSSNGNGGILHQVQDFNAFLERAAQALESR